MSEEIKIILNIIKKASKREANSYNALIQTDSKKYKQLLDYITNLQQENKQLKETIKEATRILNSAKNHYGNDGKNWVLERVINLLGDKENE